MRHATNDPRESGPGTHFDCVSHHSPPGVARVTLGGVDREARMVHAELWSGAGNFRLTDMENAGKRGKLCRTLRFQGCPWAWEQNPAATPLQKAEARWSRTIYYKVYDLAGADCTYQHEVEINRTFDVVKEAIESMLIDARADGVMVNTGAVHCVEESIRGVDAPVPTLEAGVSGQWSASAGNHGISMRQTNDPNEWSEITHGQTSGAAYRIARKVWDQVTKAATMREAVEILRAAAARLHGYCAMD